MDTKDIILIIQRLAVVEAKLDLLYIFFYFIIGGIITNIIASAWLVITQSHRRQAFRS